MPFQPDIPGVLQGNLQVPVVTSAGLPPSTILSVNTPWNVQINWSIMGAIAPSLGGDWRLQVYLESMGPGFEGSVAGPVAVPLAEAAPANIRNYARNLVIPAIAAIVPGAYKLVVTLLHVNAGVPTQMAGFVEGPILQFIP